LAQRISTGESLRLPISELTIIPNGEKRKELSLISDKDWKIAQDRFQVIRPLVHAPLRSKAEVEARAKEYHVHATSVYRWLKLYEEKDLLTALMPKDRIDTGKSRLPKEIENIIQKVIEKHYLTSQRKTAQWVCTRVRNLCSKAGLKMPHPNTIRNRIAAISEKTKVSKRRGARAAFQQYEPAVGRFPGAETTLSVVQIDHTKLDIIVVDEVHRLPLGRPWITVAIDVFSRVVTGFYVSLDPPNALSVGLCLVHSIQTKDEWLIKKNIETPWPCWGKPKTIHVDNAKEFRGQVLERACSQYNISIEWRPVKTPHYGGHIERLIGSISTELHGLPGTTFSDVKDRGDYNSTAKASLTLGELEKWLGHLIVEVYHQRIHSALDTTPIGKYKEGILGGEDQLGVGTPRVIEDTWRLTLDFMPFVERSIQKYGVAVEGIHYYHDVLRRWINATVDDHSKAKRKFIFKRDPRDISVIWFYDPELETYHQIPYRTLSFPAISIWELKRIKRKLREEGRRNFDERLIFEAYDRLERIEKQATRKTKQVRREKKKPVRRKKPDPPPPSSISDIPDLEPFDELDFNI